MTLTGHSLFFKDNFMEQKGLKEILTKKCQELGYDLVTLNLSTYNKDKTLSIVVDRVAPIDMDAIVEVTHSLNEFLDEIDPFEGGYTLDISSLGAEKPLKIECLKDYISSYVHVHIINPINGENIYEGDLVDVKEDSITISYHVKTRIKTVDIPKSNISKIRLAIKF